MATDLRTIPDPGGPVSANLFWWNTMGAEERLAHLTYSQVQARLGQPALGPALWLATLRAPTAGETDATRVNGIVLANWEGYIRLLPVLRMPKEQC